MEKVNTKETINLLDLLSETESDTSDLILTPRRKKIKRKYRQSGAVDMNNHNNGCVCSKSDMRAISLWLVALLIAFWIIALSWLAAALYSEIKRMDISIKAVIAGSEGVPDALQKCHSMSRDLQNNQTVIFSHLSDLKLQINNFTLQLTNIQHGLHQVQEWVRAAPELANVPKNLNALSTTVVSLGSQISDLGNTVVNLKETNSRLQDVQSIVLQNISDIQNSMSELMNVTQRPQTLSINETKAKTDELNAAILQLTTSVTNINATLFARLKWIKQDQKKDHTTLETLREVVQNVSSKVMSLEGEYANIFEQVAILPSLTDQTKQMRLANTELNETLKRLEQTLRNHTAILNVITKMRDQKDTANNKDKSLEAVLGDVITESHSELDDASQKELQRVSTNV